MPIQCLISNVLYIIGNRIWMKYQGSLPILAKVLYVTVTTLSDIQTLGEEYTGVIQINSNLKQLPSKKVLRTSIYAL